LIHTPTLWDEQWYLETAQRGYSYHPKQESSVAFFPAFPLLIAMIAKPTGIPTAWTALAVSNAFLIGSFVLIFVYARGNGNGQNETRAASVGRQPLYTVPAFGMFPPTLFFRMAYTESLFVFLNILAMRH